MEFDNIIQVSTYFSDKKVCKDYLAKLRWNNNPQCPHCQHDKCYKMKYNYKCSKCRKQFSETKGTIFENSAIPLQKWFVAIWLFTSHKKGYASTQLAKDLGITQKSAWFMLQRIRYAMETKTFEKGGDKLDGIVQVDETYVGGDISKMNFKSRARFKGKDVKGTSQKTPVVGMITKDEVRTIKMDKVTKKALKEVMKKEINDGAIVVTDSFKGYKWAIDHFKKHESVSHGTGEYVNIRGYHTNSIEGFWSIFKRGVYGIYHHVSKKHLNKYLDEFEYRYNNRHSSEFIRFENFMSRCNV